MKYSLLTRLRRNGVFYLFSALLLLIGIPVYQALVLIPRGYGNALSATNLHHIAIYLAWIGSHSTSFLLYRVLLLIAFALLLTMPFSLFRIIVAQELMAQQEEAELAEQENEEIREDAENKEDARSADKQKEDDTIGEQGELEEDDENEEESKVESSAGAEDGMPPYAWRGKGFAVIAAWSGAIGVFAYVLGTLVSTLFLLFSSHGLTTSTNVSTSTTIFLSIFSITTNTVGIGLLALAALFFGAVIARRGTRLWPVEWIGFGYGALAVSALLSGSAVSVASAPTSGQTGLTSPAILLFALWMGWLGIMLVRLHPEP